MKEDKKGKGKGKGSDADLWLGVDLGGTKILAAVVNRAGEVLGESKKKTKPDSGADAVIDRIVATVEEAVSAAGVGMDRISGAGVGAPGAVDLASGVVYQAPNLQGWTDIPLGELLRKKLQMPVFVDNDVNLGTLGEFVYGAGQGSRHLVGVFVGTGVGGGIVVDGQVHRGARYSAGEVGHTVILPHGPLCGCGRRGCLEALASRTAIEREVREALALGRPSMLADRLIDGNVRLTSGMIKEALDQDDELMKEVMGQAQFYLGLLAGNLVNLLDPEVIVFGGGVVEALGDDFVDGIRRTAEPYFLNQRNVERVRMAASRLGDHAGVLGAAVLAYQQSPPAKEPSRA